MSKVLTVVKKAIRKEVTGTNKLISFLVTSFTHRLSAFFHKLDTCMGLTVLHDINIRQENMRRIENSSTLEFHVQFYVKVKCVAVL